MIGNLDTHDEPCRILCGDANVHVLSIGPASRPSIPFLPRWTMPWLRSSGPAHTRRRSAQIRGRWG